MLYAAPFGWPFDAADTCMYATLHDHIAQHCGGALDAEEARAAFAAPLAVLRAARASAKRGGAPRSCAAGIRATPPCLVLLTE